MIESCSRIRNGRLFTECFFFFFFGTEPKNLRPVILRNNQIEPGLPGTVAKPMRDLDPHRKESRTFTAGPKPRPPRGALEQVPYQVQHVTGRGRGGLGTRRMDIMFFDTPAIYCPGSQSRDTCVCVVQFGAIKYLSGASGTVCIATCTR